MHYTFLADDRVESVATAIGGLSPSTPPQNRLLEALLKQFPQAIADLAWVVGTLGAVIHWFEGDMDLCVRERSLLWIVSVQEYTQPNVGGETEELHEVVIRVQPGL